MKQLSINDTVNVLEIVKVFNIHITNLKVKYPKNSWLSFAHTVEFNMTLGYVRVNAGMSHWNVFVDDNGAYTFKRFP